MANWKTSLLSSGLPLEHSVADAYRSAGIKSVSAYQYERTNADGERKDFSVDVLATKVYQTDQYFFELSFLTECKYRRPGRAWYFMPQNIESYVQPKPTKLLFATDYLSPVVKLDIEAMEEILGDYDVCGRGVQISDKGANRNAIRRAINQLRYAFSKLVARKIEHQLLSQNSGTVRENTVFALLPVVVTTADLWRIDPQVTISQIQEADSPGDIAEPREKVLVHREPTSELRKYNMRNYKAKLYRNDLSDDLSDLADKVIRSNFRSSSLPGPLDTDEYIDGISYHHPSLFLFVTLENLQDEVGKITEFFEREEVRTLRS